MHNREKPTFCSECHSNHLTIDSVNLSKLSNELGVSKLGAAFCEDCGQSDLYWTISPGTVALTEFINQCDKWARHCGSLIQKYNRMQFNTNVGG